jgi:hypothetical protein
LYHQTSKWTPEEQQWIKDLLNKVKMGYALGGNLTKELNKTNQEKEQKDREITDLNQKNTELTKEAENANKEKQDLKEQFDKKDIEIQDLQQKVEQVTTEKETEKKEKEERQNKVYEQYERMITTERELGREKSKNVKLEEENKTMQKEHHERIQTLEDDFIMMNNTLNDSKKMNTTSTQKVTQLENEVRDLTEKSKNSFRDGLIVGGLGVGAVATTISLAVYQNNSTPTSNSTLTSNAEYGQNTLTPVIPVGEYLSIPPDIQGISSGMTSDTNTGTLCSGAVCHNNGETYGTGCAAISNQQDDVTRSPFYSIASGVELVTNISGSQCLGTFVSSHLENKPLQDANAIHTSLFIPSYSYMPLTPPEHPSDSLLWRQILKTDEKQFKQHMKRFFEHLGYRVTMMKASHDWGVDMIIERGWEKIVIQLKQWKDNVGFDAIREVHTAIKHYKATRAMVICTNKFTKNALELAHENNVDCWDGTRLLQELYKHQFFLPPEYN